MNIGDIASTAFQALVIAEVVALVVARRRMQRVTAKGLGASWHARLEALTQLALPVLRPALLLVVVITAAAVFATALGAEWPAAPGFVLVPALAGLLTWHTARDLDWEHAGRAAANV